MAARRRASRKRRKPAPRRRAKRASKKTLSTRVTALEKKVASLNKPAISSSRKRKGRTIITPQGAIYLTPRSHRLT